MAVILSRKGGGGSSGGGAPSGAAGGDLSGTYPNPSISSAVISAFGRTLVDDANAAAARTTLGVTTPLFTAYALLRDEKTANTQGGAATTGSFQTRTLNTESFDPSGIVSVAANQFTLQAGSYFLKARAPFYGTERTLLKIRNITDSTDAVIGQVGFVTDPASEPAAVDSTMVHLAGRTTIAGAKVFELQYRCVSDNSGNASALGIACNFGVTEVYAEVEIYKE